MLDSMNICKSLSINNETVMKNPKILKFVLDHLKTKKLCNHTITKLSLVIGYVPD